MGSQHFIEWSKHFTALIALWVSLAAAAYADPAGQLVRIQVRSGNTPHEISGVIVGRERIVTSSAALQTNDASIVSVSLPGGAEFSQVSGIYRHRELAVLTVAGVAPPVGASMAAGDPTGNLPVTLAWVNATGMETRSQRVSSGAAINYDARTPGRALGGGIFNTCGQLVSIILPRGASSSAIERATRYDSTRTLTSSGLARVELNAGLQAANITLPVSAEPCGAAPGEGQAGASAAPQDIQPDAASASTGAADAQRQDDQPAASSPEDERVAELEQRLAVAERTKSSKASELRALRAELDEARTAAEDARKRALENQEGLEDLVEQEREGKEKIAQNSLYGFIAAGVVLLLIVGVAVFFLTRAKKRSSELEREVDQFAAQDLKRETTPDWVLVSDAGRLKLRGALLADERRGSIIGRGQSDADVLIDTEQISRKHARFFFRNGQLLIEDMNSMNGTSVNGRRLSPGETFEVRDGDRIEFATNAYVLQRTT